MVTDRDLVEPEPSTPRSTTSSAVTVRHARQLQVVIDGQPTQIWTTELTVDAALDQLGVRLADAEVSASRSERLPLTGARVGVQLPDQVTVLHDQRRTTVVTTAQTVAALLREAGVRVGRDDLVNVAPRPRGRDRDADRRHPRRRRARSAEASPSTTPSCAEPILRATRASRRSCSAAATAVA